MNSSLLKIAFGLLDRGYLPDRVIRAGIRRLLAKRLDKLVAGGHDATASFIETMKHGEIAQHTDAANEQHYEVPAEFYTHCLGKYRKYSSCYFANRGDDLDKAEANALTLTCDHADLQDGQDILELGCGWGSLTLWMAARYPNSRITAVSNSNSQRHYIETQAAERGLTNLRVITQNINTFATDATFDRIVSVEMFEHMRNYRELLHRAAGWLRNDGKLFVHIFCHREHTYPYETEGEANWLGRYFFTGGIMPGENIFEHFTDDLALCDQWRWNGRHYEATANGWLANLDANNAAVMPILERTYGQGEATKWFNRWRVFFMACAELWGYRDGTEWFVGHYLLEPARKQMLSAEEISPCALQPA